MATLFFSYSHKDEALRDELEVHLATLRRERLIETVHDRRILAGDDLGPAIDAYLDAADVILCLVSPDFIASDYCYGIEMARALERHHEGSARVIPVVLRHCDWEHTPLAGLRGTPRDNRPVMLWPMRDEAWLEVAKDVRTAVEQFGAARDSSASARVADPKTLTGTADTTATGPVAVRTRARSSNLAIPHEPTELEQDRFLRDAFAFVQEYVAASLAEAKTRNPGVDGDVVSIDATRFTASAYRDGRRMSAVLVFTGGIAGRGVAYMIGEDRGVNAANGIFRVAVEDGRLGFRGQFDGFGYGREEAKGKEDVAEAVWVAFFRPLQTMR